MKYKCEQCGREAKVVRFDLDSKEKKQKCDKCYFKKKDELNLLSKSRN